MHMTFWCVQAAEVCSEWLGQRQGPTYPLWAHMLMWYARLHAAEDSIALRQVGSLLLTHLVCSEQVE